jgi:ectoine hydroxylase-related dioxygenase (phytanoyl-CoA dioxygenase family)
MTVTTTPAPRVLSDDELDSYRRDGYVVVPGLIGRAEVRRLDAEIDRMIAGGQREGTPSGWIFALHRQESDICAAFAADDRILALVEQVVSPGVGLHSSKLVAKPPRSHDVCHWHQDETYYFDRGADPVMRSQVRMSIWVPLQDANQDNGCLWVVPGSHTAGIEGYREVGDGHCRRKLLKADYADEHAIPLGVRAGDAVLFSSYLWHHSKGNATDRVRRAFIVSYQEATIPRDAYGNPAAVLRAASWRGRRPDRSRRGDAAT